MPRGTHRRERRVAVAVGVVGCGVEAAAVVRERANVLELGEPQTFKLSTISAVEMRTSQAQDQATAARADGRGEGLELRLVVVHEILPEASELLAVEGEGEGDAVRFEAVDGGVGVRLEGGERWHDARHRRGRVGGGERGARARDGARDGRGAVGRGAKWVVGRRVRGRHLERRLERRLERPLERRLERRLERGHPHAPEATFVV